MRIQSSYFPIAIGYGFIRKTWELRDATIVFRDHHEREYKQIPILVVDKAMIALCCGLVSISIWPIYLYHDLRAVELYFNPTLETHWYTSQKTSLVDYLFS